MSSWLVPHPGAPEPSQRGSGDIPSLAPVLGQGGVSSLENIPSPPQAWQGLEEPLEATQALGALVLHKRALSELLAGVVLLSAHLAVWAGAWLSLCEDHSLSAGLFHSGVV